MPPITTTCIATLVLAGATLGAADIDVDLTLLENQRMRRTLVQPLAVEGEKADVLLADVRRVWIHWTGRKGAPEIRYRGLVADERMARLDALGVERTETPLGLARALPGQPGFHLIALGPDEVLMAPTRLLERLAPRDWPAAAGAVLTFSGPATDLKLGGLKEELTAFRFAWTPENELVLSAVARDDEDAERSYHWVKRRIGLLGLAAGLGADKAEFPYALLKKADFEVRGDTVRVTRSLDEAMEHDAVDYLVYQVKRKLRKFRPRQTKA